MKEIKKPKKPLIYYYSIVLIVLLLFNVLAMPWLMERQIKSVDYNTFISMTEEKDIGQVQISTQDNTVTFTDKEEEQIYKTAMVDDTDLTQRLYEAGASFSGEEIKQMSPPLSFFLSWILPIIIFVAIGQLMSKKMIERAGGKNAMSFGKGKSTMYCIY